MAYKNIKKRRSSQGKPAVQVAPFDLRSVNPCGRVDVLAAKTIEQLAQSRAPELLPLLNEHREVIHATLNSKLGPHAIGFDLVGLMDDVSPYIPALEELARGLIVRYMAARTQGGVTP